MQSGPDGPDRSDEEGEGKNPPYAPLHGPQAPQEPSVGPPPPAAWGDPGQGPQAPSFPPQAPPPPPPQAPGYGGPVPPGGWQAPLGQAPGWGGAPLASWASRVGAQLLDWLIVAVPVAILGGIVAAIFIAGSNVGGVVTAIVFGGLWLVATFLYAPVLMAREGAHNGQTWGKQIVGITVVRDTGEQVGFGWAALRQIVVIQILFGWIGGFFASIPTIVNYLWPLWDGQNRCLHDMVVSSHVVRR